MKIPILFLILITLIAKGAFADTFTVTSNAETGPGTLTEALLEAAQNGTDVQDLITFNLPYGTREQRTIMVSTQLPYLTSNLVIDGTTQPGDPFGISNAKVELDATDDLRYQQMFHSELSTNIEIYGLYLKGLFYTGYAVHFEKVSHVVFGKPGKGNLVNSFSYGLYSEERESESRDFVIQGNLFGTNETGTAIGGNVMNNAIDFVNVKDVTIGGNSSGEGNLICTRLEPININFNAVGTPGFLKIYGNKIGTDITGVNNIIHESGDGIEINGKNDGDGRAGGTTDLRLEMVNNIITCATSLFKLRDTFFIKGNLIGLGADYKQNIADHGLATAFSISECGQGIIGGNLPEDQNYITNYPEGVFEAYTASVTILQNSFRCNNVGINRFTSDGSDSYVDITMITASSVKGQASPYAVIQLYINDDCGTVCEGKTYFASVKADANGDWNYQGSVPGDVVATATNIIGATSQFSKSTIDESGIQVTNTSCGKQNGSIKNIKILSGTSWHWEDENGNVVGNDIQLTGIKAGTYYLKVETGNNSSCSATSPPIAVGNADLPQSAPNVSVTNISCGQSTGALTTGELSGFTAKWLNNGQIVGSGFTISGLPAGKYSLQLSATNDATCTQTYGPYEIKNSGAVHMLELTNVQITNATCDEFNGSITGITYSAPLSDDMYINWEYEDGTLWGTRSLSLFVVAAGKYRLIIKDPANCDTLFSPFYTINGIGAITLDSSQLKVTPANICGHPAGTITGMKASNGETYSWVPDNGSPTVTTLDAQGLTSTTYTLTVANHYGCSVTSLPVFIPPASNPDWSYIQVESADAFCGGSNGHVYISNVQNSSQYSYRWVNTISPQIILSTNLHLDNIDEGNYYLYAKDDKGCEEHISTSSIGNIPGPTVYESDQVVQNEICGNKDGAILNVFVNGGNAPVQEMWKDQLGNIISTDGSAKNLSEGVYTLYAQDAKGCTANSSAIKIENETRNYVMPVYRDAVIRKGTMATVTVTNFQPGTYRLYDNSSLQAPIQENNTGTFTTTALTEDKTYYVTVSTGSCDSALAEVNVQIATNTVVSIPGAFTPDGNGLNDVVKPIVQGLFTLEDFSIYDRFGHRVFRTSDINKGWKGDSNGLPLDVGIYIWIIKGTDTDNKLLVRKGTVVLLR